MFFVAIFKTYIDKIFHDIDFASIDRILIKSNLDDKLMFIELFSYVHFFSMSKRNEPKKRHSRGRGSRIPLRHPLPLKDPSHRWHRDFIGFKNFVFGVSEKGYLSYG